MLICVGFAFKANVEVCLMMVPVFEQIEQIVAQVQNIEGQNQKLFLLLQMYFFVIYQYFVIFVGFMLNQYERIQSNALYVS